MHAPGRSCASCCHAVVPAKDKSPALSGWLQARGLAFCEIYGKRLGRRFLIPLINAGGMVCGGRDFVGKELDLFESAATAAA